MAQMRIPTSRLRKNMIVKSDVYTRSGVIIVPAGTEVTKDVVSLLTRHFIDDVIVEYGTGEQEEKEPIVEPKRVSDEQMIAFKESFQVAEETLSKSLKGIADQDKDIDVNALLGMLNKIIGTSSNEVNLCDMLFKMKQSAENLYSHSINVALFAQVLAKWAEFTVEEIELAGIAGLLHDIGVLKFLDENKGNFSFRDEYDKKAYDKHVVYGYNMIKDKDIDSRIKQAVLAHHERLDRSGFPIGISGNGISNIARVIAIADAYDTLTMEEEGKDDISPFMVLRILEEARGKFDPKLLMLFIERMAQDFIQYEVILSNGKRGKIVMINKFDLTRPLIQVGTTFIDLALRKDITIVKMFE